MFADLGVFAAALAVSFVIPGPDVMLLFSRALSGGARAAAPVGAGLVVGKVTLMTVAFLGMAAVVHMIGPAFIAVKLVGGAYLVILAIRMWRRSSSTASFDSLAEASPLSRTGTGLLHGVALGSVLTVANPQALIFYFAVVPSVLHGPHVSVVEYVGLVATLTCVVAVIAAAYVGAATRLRRRLHVSKTRRAERVGALLLAVTGLAIATR